MSDTILPPRARTPCIGDTRLALLLAAMRERQDATPVPPTFVWPPSSAVFKAPRP